MRRKIYVHVGMEKTGSSYIQRFFHENSHILKQKKIVYPIIDGQENHSMLAFARGALPDAVGELSQCRWQGLPR